MRKLVSTTTVITLLTLLGAVGADRHVFVVNKSVPRPYHARRKDLSTSIFT